MDIWWCWNLPRLYNEQHLTLSQPVSVQDFLHQEYHCSQVQISTKATQNKHLRRGKSSNVQNLWYWASCISSPHNFLFRDSTNQPTPAQTTQPNPWPSNEYIFVSTFPPFPHHNLDLSQTQVQGAVDLATRLEWMGQKVQRRYQTSVLRKISNAQILVALLACC